MAKIIFEKLTVEEEKKVLGGDPQNPQVGICIAPKPYITCPPD